MSQVPTLLPNGTPRQRIAPAALQRWLVVVTVVAMQALTMGTFTYSFTFWVEPWSQNFAVERAEIMAVVTTRIYAVAAVSFFLGRYIDRLPQRWVASAGIVFYSCAMWSVSAATGLGMVFGAYALLVPAAMVLAGPLASVAFVSQVFDQRRGLALGVAALGTSIGGMVVPNVCVMLVESGGWRYAHTVLAASSLVLLPLIWLTLKHRPAAAHSDDAQGEAGKASAKIPAMTNLQMLRQRDLWVCVVTFATGFAVFTSVQFNIAPLATDLGIGLKQAALFVSAFTVSTVGGRLIVGYLSDKMDPRYLFLGIAVTILVAVITLAARPGFATLVVAFAIMGLGTGGYMPLKAVLLGRIFGPTNVGRAMGVSAPLIAIYAVGPIYAGWVRDTTGAYDVVLYTAIAATIITAPLIMMLRVRY